MGGKLLSVVFGCLMSLATPIYFDNCGEHGFVVNDVEVAGCIWSPCTIAVGSAVTVTIHSVNTETDFIALNGRAYIVQSGHRWQLDVTPTDLCDHWGGCPLSESTTRIYSGDVYFNRTLLRRPGQLRLTATDEESDEEYAFCILIPVYLV